MSARPDGPSLAVLRRRAELLDRTRRFFRARGVLEVETPLLGTGLVVDEHIDPIACSVAGAARYLLPSPEAPMKRLLVAGSGPIFQICKAFRDGERGRLHRPEFTMLEWYRPGVSYHDLMDEVGELLRDLLGIEGWVKRTYRDVFADALGIDPLATGEAALASVAAEHGVAPASAPTSVDGWLNVLFATCVEPRLDPARATFVHDFPASQAALASVSRGVAERFELIYGGMELCNGYQELRDADEHRARFTAANAARARPIPADERLIEAIERGLPECSGVAVGFDRVVMLACGATHLADVVADADQN